MVAVVRWRWLLLILLISAVGAFSQLSKRRGIDSKESRRVISLVRAICIDETLFVFVEESRVDRDESAFASPTQIRQVVSVRGFRVDRDATVEEIHCQELDSISLNTVLLFAHEGMPYLLSDFINDGSAVLWSWSPASVKLTPTSAMPDWAETGLAITSLSERSDFFHRQTSEYGASTTHVVLPTERDSMTLCGNEIHFKQIGLEFRGFVSKAGVVTKDLGAWKLEPRK